MDDAIPPLRIHGLNEAPVRPDGDYVVYWMIATRRLAWNYALDHAMAHARALDLPLVIFEPLRIGYEWASARHHRFVLDGMREHAEALEGSGVGYFPYVEPEAGAGKGLLEALAEHAAVVVTDVYPAFFLPRMTKAAAELLPVRLEGVDSCGLLPLKAAEKTYSSAYHFRRFLQKTLPEHLVEMPSANPLSSHELEPFDDAATGEIQSRWPPAGDGLLEGETDALEALDIDLSVPPVEMRGGNRAARERLERFLESGLDRYGEERNHPDAEAASLLSPWLHWGHLSAHEVFDAVARRDGWSPSRLSDSADGKREGWWGMDASGEAFLDELVTWRELGYAYCWLREDYAEYDTLPEWARETLEEHASDPREHVYTLEEFEEAATHDEVWNAAQRQLLEEGVIHNYLRMLWGKKILEWTEHPREALEIMEELNNKWAVDGRDPNSWSGIFWVLGRFDRGWPEREIYGKVRSMTTASTRRKIRLDQYLERWGPAEAD